jgi:hypothetical protein
MGVARKWQPVALERAATYLYRHDGLFVGVVWWCGGQRGLMLRYAGQDAFLL